MKRIRGYRETISRARMANTRTAWL